ncbi:MAG: methyltransferase [Acidobacteria bacterium]|nr:methyltransferase [Acidobacteriota bacterium]
MNAVSPELAHAMPPAAQVMQMAMGFIVSQSLAVAARLRIADHLKDGAKTAGELAALTATHEPSLDRLLRALASLGVLYKDANNRFSNTALGDVLRADHPQSMRAALHMMGDPEHWNSHGNMQQSVRTGEIAFDYTFGQPVFPYFAENPAAAAVFDESMTSFSAAVAESVAAAYDFSGAKTIADIAGGRGILLAKILEKNPHAEGILFEQSHVLEGNILAREGVAGRTRLVAGDFFAEIPVAADVYLMKFIIHDWNDEQSVAILRNLAKSAPKGSKLLLVETVVEEDDNAPSLSKIMDLNMLVMTGGRERKPSEYAALLEQAGFRLEKVYPTMPLQVVEAVRG